MTITTKSTGEKKAPPDELLSEKGDENAPPAFGIRSYLHEFYDWRPFDTGVGAGDGDAFYLIPPVSESARRLIYVFRALTVIGLLLLVLGAVGILVGYMWPKERPTVVFELEQLKQHKEGYMLPDEISDKFYEDKMRSWKLAGLIVFACGGTILAISLLVPTCARLFGHSGLASDLNTPVEPPVKIFPATPPKLSEKRSAGSPPASPTERRVPAIEELTQVQPTEANLEKRRRTSGDEVLMMEEDEQKRT